MLPARRRQLARTVVRAVIVVLGAYLVARWARSSFHQSQSIIGGEIGIRYWEIARISFARGNGLPLWDRTQCGGLPLLGNHEASLLSSVFVGLSGIHGDSFGRWYPTIGLGIGCVGCYLWCRRALELGFVASFYAGALFITCGFLSLQLAVRMYYVPLAWIPWVLYFARVGERDLRGAALAGGVLALMVLEGGFVSALYALVALAIVTLPRFASQQSGLWPTARMLTVALGIFVLVSGIKLFPVVIQLMRYPHVSAAPDQLKWQDLAPIFLDKERYDGLPGHGYHWNEYRAYLGPIAFGSAIAGAGTALLLKPRRWGLALLLLVALLLMRGSYSPIAPFALISKIPLFDQLQVPSRFVAVASLAMAAASAVAIDRALNLLVRNRGWRLVVLAVACLAVWDPIVEGAKIHKASGSEPWLPRPDPVFSAYHLVPGEDFNRSMEYPERNIGAPVCARTWEHPQAKDLMVGDRPQAFLDGPEAGSISAIDISQNTYRVSASLTHPTRIHINQTFDPDWSAEAGIVVPSPNGQLDIQLPAGSRTFQVRYRPSGMTAGIVASTLGLLLLLSILAMPMLARRQRRPVIASRQPLPGSTHTAE